jgi:hypothetical protein
MYEIGAVVLGVIVLLAFVAFADSVTEKDEEERKHKDDDE